VANVFLGLMEKLDLQNEIREKCLLPNTVLLHSCSLNIPMNMFSKLFFNKFPTFCRWRNEIACDWKRIHNEIFNVPYSSLTIFRLIRSRRINLVMPAACRLTRELHTQDFGGENIRISSSWRHKRRWVIVIKMDFNEVGCKGMSWIEMTQVRERWRAFVNAEMNIRVQ